MATIQKKLRQQLIDKQIKNYQGCIEGHPSLGKGFNKVNHVDYEREIIVYATQFDSSVNDVKGGEVEHKNTFNIRIMKKNRKTDQFEFTGYKEKLDCTDAFYN